MVPCSIESLSLSTFFGAASFGNPLVLLLGPSRSPPLCLNVCLGGLPCRQRHHKFGVDPRHHALPEPPLPPLAPPPGSTASTRSAPTNIVWAGQAFSVPALLGAGFGLQAPAWWYPPFCRVLTPSPLTGTKGAHRDGAAVGDVKQNPHRNGVRI